MKLKKCIDCGAPVSKMAKTCPQCGAPQARRYGFWSVLVIVFGAISVYSLLASSPKGPENIDVSSSPTGRCRQFVQLDRDASLEIINIWSKTTPNGKGRIVGKMVAHSRALVLDTLADDFKVKSLYDGSVGYVNQVQVEAMLNLNDKTLKPCK